MFYLLGPWRLDSLMTQPIKQVSMELTITRPDDWHLHLRDNEFLTRTVNDTARCFGRAIVMPNLKPPVTTVPLAEAYYERIKSHLNSKLEFEPLMTLYLTDKTSVADIEAAVASPIVHAVKLYPAGATTNSDAGLTKINNATKVFEAMEKLGLPLLIHGESTHSEIDVFDREKHFIDNTLTRVRENFPALKIVFEHITTADAAAFVKEANDKTAATITPQHIMYNRNQLLVGGIRPHAYCLPVLKRESHRQALLEAATSGSPKFFLGTDSAPHTQSAKESACGCAGIYSAHIGIEIYAQLFDEANALDKLEGFASFFGPDFYGLPRNSQTITLVKEVETVAEQLSFGQENLIPLLAGESIAWRLK